MKDLIKALLGFIIAIFGFVSLCLFETLGWQTFNYYDNIDLLSYFITGVGSYIFAWYLCVHLDASQGDDAQ